VSTLKPVGELTPDDLRIYPVWEFSLAYEHIDDTLVQPVKKLPVEYLDGRVVGTQVFLANGDQPWAMIGNVDPNSAHKTTHFIDVGIFEHGVWFNLARYHDVDAVRRGPVALAEFLSLSVREVFPIRYDIRPFCVGDPAALAGTIQEEPPERLTLSEMIALAVPPRAKT
jgi:hypothetical protein